ncbi:hypothetical protein ACQKWADRAFT_288103, partial [Trichoderma austrokoningii]
MMLLPPWLHLLKLLVLRARSRLSHGVVMHTKAWRDLYLRQDRGSRRQNTADGRTNAKEKGIERKKKEARLQCDQLHAGAAAAAPTTTSNTVQQVISRNFLAADGHDGTHRGLNLSNRPARQFGSRHLIGQVLAPGRLGRAIFSLGAVSHAAIESLFSAQPLRNEEVGGRALLFFLLFLALACLRFCDWLADELLDRSSTLSLCWEEDAGGCCVGIFGAIADGGQDFLLLALGGLRQDRRQRKKSHHQPVINQDPAAGTQAQQTLNATGTVVPGGSTDGPVCSHARKVASTCVSPRCRG